MHYFDRLLKVMFAFVAAQYSADMEIARVIIGIFFFYDFAFAIEHEKQTDQRKNSQS